MLRHMSSARRALPALLLLLAAVVAGCSGGGSSGAQEGEDPLASGAPQLEATSTTGVLRGVVVDEAIRPIGNATVRLTGPQEGEAVTGPDGFFGFSGLQPGTYFVKASKLAYAEAQASAEVRAGVDDPPVVKVQLTFLPSEAPFAFGIKYEGFAECIVPGANLCFILNFYPCFAAGQCNNLTNDDSWFFIYDSLVAQQRHPDWTQLEFVWETTQPVTDWLTFRVSAHSPDDGAGVDERRINPSGKSPVVASLNRTQAEEWDLGTEEGFSVETFSGGTDLTCGGLPARACVGFVLNQRIDYYFHMFYGFLPPEGWQFSVDGLPAPPA